MTELVSLILNLGGILCDHNIQPIYHPDHTPTKHKHQHHPHHPHMLCFSYSKHSLIAAQLFQWDPLQFHAKIWRENGRKLLRERNLGIGGKKNSSSGGGGYGNPADWEIEVTLCAADPTVISPNIFILIITLITLITL